MSTDPIADNRAVIDRITAGQAVLLVGPHAHEHVVPADTLPDNAREGTWLIIEHTPDRLQIIGIDHQLTSGRRDHLNQRMQQLRDQRRGRRFNAG